MTKKTTRNGGKSGAGKGSTPRTQSAGQRSGKPAKTGKSLPPWMPDLPPTGGGAKSSAPATRRAAPARTSGRFVDPHAQREAQRYDQPIASREAILGFLEAAEGPQTAEEIAGPLGLEAPDRFEALSKRLGAMVRDGQLVQNRRGGFAPVQHTALIAGTVIANPDGFGFLRPDAGGGDDLFLPPYEMRKVMHGDRALANVTGIDRRGRREGSIARVLERGVTRLIGRFGFEVGIAYVAPDDKRIQRNVQIPQDATGGARDGQLVVVELTQAPDARRPPIGKVIAVLGDSLTPSLVVEAAIHGHNLPHEFPQEVLDEATAVPLVIEPAMIGNRVDLRDMPLVTIDGADAKDFDDAVYCESNRQGLRMKNRSGYRLVVAIADVSHYVRPGTPLDDEAQKRATSVYFPGFVVPMLPEKLSNGICSLNPKVDRMCFVCDMQVNSGGEVTQSKFYEAVMRSHARLTYDQVWKAVGEGDAEARQSIGTLLPQVERLLLPPLGDPAQLGGHLRQLELAFPLLVTLRRRGEQSRLWQPLDGARHNVATDLRRPLDALQGAVELPHGLMLRPAALLPPLQPEGLHCPRVVGLQGAEALPPI